SEARVSLDRLLEKVDRLVQAFRGSVLPVEPSFHVQLISLIALCVIFSERCLLTRYLQPQSIDDFSRHFALRLKQFRSLPFVLFTPEQFVMANIEQFGTNREVVTALYDSAREHRVHAQLITN